MTTFLQLKTDILSWLARSEDTNFQAQLPQLIKLAERRLNRDIRFRGQELVTTITCNLPLSPLPGDFLEARAVVLQGGKVLELMSPEVIRERFYDNAIGEPQAYSLEAFSIFLMPFQETRIDLVYYRAFTDFALDEDTNFLLVSHYDMFLYLCLAVAYAYLRNTEMARAFNEAYVAMRDDAGKAEVAAKSRGSAFVSHHSRRKP
ncbi:MAG: hypothetical protein HC923_00230 [Myxococcales bacterium]|nr:hypothetical protein [Myxococcales bacterium]